MIQSSTNRKIVCAVSCPVDTYSGYGRRALDFVKELLRVRPEWDIQILSQRWGDTRMGYLKDHKEWEVMSRIVPTVKNPDVWIQITVPNEFSRQGKFNIGVTAAIETTLCDPSWIEGCNRMDMVITSSQHGKDVLTKSKWSYQNGQVLETKVPVEVLFEGVDLDIFGQELNAESDIYKQIDELPTKWNYICVGHWLQGNFREDRKNIGGTVKCFLEAFKDVPNAPGLILKTSGAVTSIVDRMAIMRKLKSVRNSVQYVNSLPEVYLLHGDLPDKEMNDLYRHPKVKAMVSLTKGEGFGRPLLEFAAVGKPIVVSEWSGQLDFLKKQSTAFVRGTLTQVDASAVQPRIILAESKWFTADEGAAVDAMKMVYNKYPEWNTRASKQGNVIRQTMNRESMGDLLSYLLESLPLEVFAEVLPFNEIEDE